MAELARVNMYQPLGAPFKQWGDQDANTGTLYQGNNENMQLAFNGGTGNYYLPTPYSNATNVSAPYSQANTRMSTFGMSPEMEAASIKSLGSYDQLMQAQIDKLMAPPTFPDQYLKPASQVMGIAGGLANMYLGFQNLKTQKEYLGMAKEQWGATKDEMARIQGVRANITAAYNK